MRLRAGLSRVAYSAIENGKADPRVSNLQKLADALNISIAEIIKPIPHISNLRFRSKKMLNTREENKREQIIADVAYWLDDFHFLENELKNKISFKLSNCKGRDPKMMAGIARQALRLKEKDVIVDICGLMENAGVKIKLVDSDLDNFFGFSAFDQDGNAVIAVHVSKKITV